MTIPAKFCEGCGTEITGSPQVACTDCLLEYRQYVRQNKLKVGFHIPEGTWDNWRKSHASRRKSAVHNEIMQFFGYRHLPEQFQGTSKMFHDLAHQMNSSLPDCREKEAGLRKLLEAKDCMVRARTLATAEGAGGRT